MAMKDEIIKILEKYIEDVEDYHGIEWEMVDKDSFKDIAEEIENLCYKDKIKCHEAPPSAYDGSGLDRYHVDVVGLYSCSDMTNRPVKPHHTIRNNDPYLDGYALTIDEIKELLEYYDEAWDEDDNAGYYNFIECYMSHENKESVNVYKK